MHCFLRMPKKFHGENTKAVTARARKEAVRQTEKANKEKEIEDAYWADDNKTAIRKQQRKVRLVQFKFNFISKIQSFIQIQQDDKDKKKQEQLERKQMSRDALEDEMSSLKSAKPAAPQKVTRSDIQGSIGRLYLALLIRQVIFYVFHLCLGFRGEN